MEKPRAVLDACVLYPAPLRDFLMECAVADFYQPRWTEAIHEEWMRNLLANRPQLTRERLDRTRDLMNHAMPEAIVTGYEQRIRDLALPDPGDRHILAAALQCRASVIVTFNLRHFPASALNQYRIQAQRPDTFLMEVVGGQIEEFLIMTRRHRARLRHPPKNAGEYIATLRQNQLAKIADVLDEHKQEI